MLAHFEPEIQQGSHLNITANHNLYGSLAQIDTYGQNKKKYIYIYIHVCFAVGVLDVRYTANIYIISYVQDSRFLPFHPLTLSDSL